MHIQTLLLNVKMVCHMCPRFAGGTKTNNNNDNNKKKPYTLRCLHRFTTSDIASGIY